MVHSSDSTGDAQPKPADDPTLKTKSLETIKSDVGMRDTIKGRFKWIWALAIGCTVIFSSIAILTNGPESARLGAIPLICLACLFVIACLWRVPQWQVKHSLDVTPANHFDRENEARKTLAQVLGGLFLVAGLYTSLETLTTAREGQITERYTKAVEQLASDHLEVKLGGIYALERIAIDSDRDRATIAEVLAAYAREHASVNKPQFQSVMADTLPEVHAICSVFRRMHSTPGFLSWLGIRRTAPLKIDLHWTQLKDVDLRGADLRRADLRCSQLFGAHLQEVNLQDGDLTGADLTNAHLEGAHLERADLSSANLGAILNDAHLLKAVLEYADVDGANFSGADLSHAKIFGLKNIEWAIITKEQIGSADTTKRAQRGWKELLPSRTK
jgi:uncharacterized protein YjbI with pentapeptide repeats